MSDQAKAVVRDALSFAEARDRAAAVSDVTYRIHLDLRDPGETYGGETTLRFGAARGATDLFLDFRGFEIGRAVLNGRELPPYDEAHCRFRLPTERLADRNEVSIRYRNRYDKGGVGLHRFVDPEDGAVYVYTDFEPFNAHRLFPCFDQPDIKATYDVEVLAPESWKVIANGSCGLVEPASGGGQRRRFIAPYRFSTYLLAVIAGPYHEVRKSAAGVDMGLFCRKSLTRFLDAEDIFELTAQGMAFYGSHFGRPYPFGKYDQVFVPEYNSGAMENIAAVTFNEHYIFRDRPTDIQLLSRAEVVLHELAHMWFGNLVTMRWWDDLWLNESFATYASYLAMSKATRFARCWENFRAQIKAWALREDQKPTTHPIAGTVADTDQTFLNFDGITYGKGAAVLKQLSAFLGENAFRDGLRLYFQRHAWKNTVLADFLGALSEAARHDLSAWSEKWLRTAGVNVLRVVRGKGTLPLTLLQEPGNGDACLRPHRVDVGFFRSGDDQKTTRVARESVLIDGPQATVPVPPGSAADFIWANDDDHAYARVFLDDASLAFAIERFETIADTLVRQNVLGTLWEMVRDGIFPAKRYVALAARLVDTEGELDVLDTALRCAQTALGRYVDQAVAAPLAADFLRALDLAAATAPAGDRRLLLARAAPGFAFGADDAAKLLGWLDGLGPEGADADQGLRWRILIRAAAFGIAGVDRKLAAELARDPSDRGKKSVYAAEAARPDSAAKEAAFADYLRTDGPSADLKKSGMGAFWWPHQADLVRPFVNRYFESLVEVERRHDLEYATRGFARLLYPHFMVEAATLARGEAFLKEIGPDRATLRRIIIEENDELARALRLQALT